MPQGENAAILRTDLTLGAVQVGKALWSLWSPLLFGAGLRSKLFKLFSALSSSETLQGSNSCCLFRQPLLVPFLLWEGRGWNHITGTFWWDPERKSWTRSRQKSEV